MNLEKNFLFVLLFSVLLDFCNILERYCNLVVLVKDGIYFLMVFYKKYNLGEGKNRDNIIRFGWIKISNVLYIFYNIF